MRYRAPSKLTLAVTAGFALAASLILAFSEPVDVRIDGQPLISDVAPVTSAREGVFVPIRPVSEALGAEAHYDKKSGEVVVTRGDQSVRLKVGSTKAKLNGMPMTLHHAPFRVRGRVMVSLSSVQQAFGVRVRFDKMTARVDVNTPGVTASTPQIQTQ